jgi:hypothetical protein
MPTPTSSVAIPSGRSSSSRKASKATAGTPDAEQLAASDDAVQTGAAKLEANRRRLTTALAAFMFRLEPVIDVMDAVAVELQSMAWRESVR